MPFFENPTAASWVQAMIYALTLAVLIGQTRLQTRALRQAEYLRCQTDFTESLRVLVQSGQHGLVYDDLAVRGQSKFAAWPNYDDSEKVTYAYFELLYELMERVYVLSLQKWLPKDEWKYWDAWLRDVAKHPLLRDVHEDNRGMFDSAFEKYMDALLPPVSVQSGAS